jgi:hypothetical protein
MALEPKLAATNFLNALENIPGLTEDAQKKVDEIQKDLPILREIVESSWSKEEKLLVLKTELSALERQIQLSISTKEENAGTSEVQQTQDEGCRNKEIETVLPKVKF